MTSSVRLLVVAVSVTFAHSTAFAAQTWTYNFLPTSSQPYTASCGECGPYFAGVNADVAGTFTLLLDWDTHVGKLIDLDDHLENVVDVVYTSKGTLNVPSIPSTRDYGIVPPWYRNVQFAAGPITYANGLGHLKSDGKIRLPNGSYSIGIPYDIFFTPTAASFSMTVPIEDYYITVEKASATFESSAWSGDVNHDGRVDKRDYLFLRKSTGANADYDAWRWSLGNVYFGSSLSTVPEPPAYLLLLTSSAPLLFSRRRSRRPL